jgi:hypothetical protein
MTSSARNARSPGESALPLPGAWVPRVPQTRAWVPWGKIVRGLVVSLMLIVAVALGTGLGATLVPGEVPTVHRAYVRPGPPVTVGGVGSGQTPVFRLEEGDYRAQWRGWAEDGCSFRAVLVPVGGGSPVLRIVEPVAGDAGAATLRGLPAGGYRVVADSACGWYVHFDRL